MRRASLALLVGSMVSPVLAEPAADLCDGQIAGFTELGERIALVPQISEGDLLSIRLLNHEEDPCRMVFRVDVLSWRGSVMDFAFDAGTLERVVLGDDAAWIDVEEDLGGRGIAAAPDNRDGEADDEDDAFAEPGDDDFADENFAKDDAEDGDVEDVDAEDWDTEDLDADEDESDGEEN
ncbi:MAG: hypothetical protein AAGF44_07640 [Pseudomonadota bacterium]